MQSGQMRMRVGKNKPFLQNELPAAPVGAHGNAPSAGLIGLEAHADYVRDAGPWP